MDVDPAPATQQVADTGPDWGSSVTIIPGGVVVDITDEPINRSGFYGDIYLGYHSVLALKVVLKRPRNLSDVHIRRFLREGHTWTKLQQLQHPNILPFYGVTWFADRIHLVSPYITNGTLDEYLSRSPNANRIELLRQAAGAVAHLHDLGVIHGDIKANNILITADSRVLLCDFGLAQIFELQPIDKAYSSGSCGNPRWASPELAMEGIRSFTSDVWAFGMTIYQVLSGHVPFFQLKGEYASIICVADGKRPEQLPNHSSTGLSYASVWAVATECWHHERAKRLVMTEVAHRLRMAAVTADRLLKSSPDSIDIDDQLGIPFEHGHADEDAFFSFNECVEMGHMMVGHHPEHGQVVLKPFRRSPLRRPNGHPRPDFQSELWACLRHPHILRFLGICVLGPQLEPRIMSEYMEQGTILTYLGSHSNANIPKMITQLSSALIYLHDELIVHGSIQSENVLISGSGCVQLAGFSSSTVIGSHIRKNDTPTVISSRWLSPEFLQTGMQTFACDVYSFGITVNEILTRERPFNGIESDERVMDAILHGERPVQPRHAFLNRVANSCWQATAGDRPTMRRIAETLSKSLWGIYSGVDVGSDKLVTQVAFSPDGSHLAYAIQSQGGSNRVRRDDTDLNRTISSPAEATIQIRQAESGSCVTDVVVHGAPLSDIVFCPDGTNLASVLTRRIILLWMRSEIMPTTLQCRSSIVKIAYSADGLRLASASEDGTLSIWIVASGLYLVRMDCKQLRPWQKTIPKSQSTFSSQPALNSRTYFECRSSLRIVNFSPNGSLMAVVGVDARKLNIWDIQMASTGFSWSIFFDEAIMQVTFSSHGTLMACNTRSPGPTLYDYIQIWNTTTREHAIELRCLPTDTVETMAFFPDSKRLVISTANREFLLWNLSSGAIEARAGFGPGLFTISPNCLWLAVETGIQTVRIWRVMSGTVFRDLEGFGGLRQIVFSLDSSRLVIVQLHNAVRIFPVAYELSDETTTA